MSLNEGDLERLNAYLLPLLGTDGRGGLSAREREVIATVVSGENRCAYCHTNYANKLGKVAGDWSFGQRVAIDHHQVAELTERERALATSPSRSTTIHRPSASTTSSICVTSASTITKSSKVFGSRVHRGDQSHRYRALGATESGIHRHSGRAGALDGIESGVMENPAIRRHMVAVVGSIAVVGLAGCSTPEPTLGGTTATVSIDGNDTGGAHAVRCRQTGWSWHIETLEKKNGFIAVLSTETGITAKSVEFRGFDGFTGAFWADTIGDAEVTGAAGSYTITGTADGTFDDKPIDAVSAKFRIQANC